MPAAESTGPIGDHELAALLAPLADATRIALAVSGGCDSLALLDCIARWRRGRADPSAVVVLSVDHGLRATSRTEAADVAALANARGMEAKVLPWTEPKPESDVEAAARAVRYRLLLGATRDYSASHLLLAHHMDDQAETLLLRLARGSGLFGLAAMRREIPVDGVTIFRPFLELARSRLAETVAVAGLVPVEDPMNTDPRFARARLRRIMPLIAANGMDAAGLAATARRLASAAEAIDAAAGDLLAEAVAVDELAVATIDPTVFFDAPEEIRMRALLRLLLAVGGNDYPPRFDRLAALASAMAGNGGQSRFKRTLAGAVVERRGGRFVVYREIGREGLPAIETKPGYRGLWDGRFRIAIGNDAPAGLMLAALGEAGRRAIGAYAPAKPAGAVAALPALWRAETVTAVPGLGYFAGGRAPFQVTCRSLLSERLATPPRFPDFVSPT